MDNNGDSACPVDGGGPDTETGCEDRVGTLPTVTPKVGLGGRWRRSPTTRTCVRGRDPSVEGQ